MLTAWNLGARGTVPDDFRTVDVPSLGILMASVMKSLLTMNERLSFSPAFSKTSGGSCHGRLALLRLCNRSKQNLANEIKLVFLFLLLCLGVSVIETHFQATTIFFVHENKRTLRVMQSRPAQWIAIGQYAGRMLDKRLSKHSLGILGDKMEATHTPYSSQCW